MIPIITRLAWGVPVSGLGMQTTPNDSELFFQNSPSETPPIVTQMAHASIRYADGTRFTVPKLFTSPTVSMASAAASFDNWTLAISHDVVNPPKSSGHVSLYYMSEDPLQYVQKEISALLNRTYPLTRYGLGKKDREDLIGDLWTILNELKKSGKPEELFWITLLENFMWGELSSNDIAVSDRPSWGRVSKAMIEDFLPWFEQTVGGSEKAIAILAKVLKKAFEKKNYMAMDLPVQNLRRALPRFLGRETKNWELKIVRERRPQKVRLVDEMIIQAATHFFLDPASDVDAKLPAIQRLTGDERGFDFYVIWGEAYSEAWEQSNVDAISRLDALFKKEGLNQEPSHIVANDLWLTLFFQTRMEKAFWDKPPEVVPLADLVIMLADSRLASYTNHFEKQFDTFEMEGETLSGAARFLVALKKYRQANKLGEASWYHHKLKIFRLFEEWLKREFPIKLHADRQALIDAHEKADAELRRDAHHDLSEFTATTKRILKEVGASQLEKILAENFVNAGNDWRLLHSNFADFFPGHETAMLEPIIRGAIHKRTAFLLQTEKPEELMRSIFNLQLCIVQILDKSLIFARNTIVEKICEWIVEHLFSGQDIATRQALIDNLFDNANLGAYLHKAEAQGYPWVLSDTNDSLREASRYRNIQEGLAYMEQSYKIAVYMGGSKYFLRALKAMMKREGERPNLGERRAFFEKLHRTQFPELQAIVKEAALALNIPLS